MLRSAVLATTVILATITCMAATAAPSNTKEADGPASLTATGSAPFHLKAEVERTDGSSKTQVEIYWKGPLEWQRTIRGGDFSQTMIVNQEKTFEEDSSDYFPVWLRSAIVAMVSPGTSVGGLRVQAGDLREFGGKQVARRLFIDPQYGGGWKANITELQTLHDRHEHLFSVPALTPRENQIHLERLREEEFRTLAQEKPEVIWPQVLDGPITGTAQFYVSIDRKGTVREVYPVRIDNERAYESACRQIKRWKFNPPMTDGVAAQAESILSFQMNTRAWGPHDPLNDAEVRKLASDMAEPVFSRGTPAGTVCSLNAAIDSDGELIEVIGGSSPPGFSGPCYNAIKKWHFKPLLENGEPRPYRAEIRF